MVADRDQIGVERLGKPRRCRAVEHPQHIGGMIGACIRRKRRLAATEPQQGRCQHRRRRHQPERIGKLLAVRQQGYTGTRGAVDIERR